MVLIGSIAILPLAGPATSYQSPLAPRIAVVRSASAISEPAITIQNATEQDEGCYQIEVEVWDGTSSQSHNTLDGVW